MKRRQFLQTTLAAPVALLPVAAAAAIPAPQGVRLSVEQNDSGYDPIAMSGQVSVTVDGVPLSHCITADEARGEAMCYSEKCAWERVIYHGKIEIHGLTKVWREAYALRGRVAKLTVVR